MFSELVAGIVVFSLGAAMIFFGRARDGVARGFIRLWPVFVLCVSTSMALLVFGIAAVIHASLTPPQ
jgi:hypothetical protein